MSNKPKPTKGRIHGSAEPVINCAFRSKIPTEDLKPNPQNPNQHPEEQLRVYAKIIRHQGWRKPVVVSNQSGLIVTGHGAWLTAKAEGWKFIPVDYQDFKSPEDELDHLLADNHLPQLASMNEAQLAAILESGERQDRDIELAGILQEEPKPVEIKTLTVQEPPKFSWCLIGLPITEFARVQEFCDSLPETAVIKTTQNDGPKDGQS